MSILVTGSTGVIGTQVLDHLSKSGATDVHALTRNLERALFPAGVKAVQGELTDVLSKLDGAPVHPAGVDALADEGG